MPVAPSAPEGSGNGIVIALGLFVAILLMGILAVLGYLAFTMSSSGM